jgi:precorrin-3B synthase
MPSGDGLLVRLNLPCGALPAGLARGIADGARRYGNGLIDLTRHGNLQLRGASEATLPELRAILAAHLPAMAGRETEAAGNILASPMAGLDPGAICDIRSIVAALAERFASYSDLKHLPAKFSCLIDDGGRFGLDDIDADLRFEAGPVAGKPCFAVALGGNAETATPAGMCTAMELPDLAIALARAFLALRGDGETAPRRMAELLKNVSISAIAGAAWGHISADPREGEDPVAPATVILDPRSGGDERWRGEVPRLHFAEGFVRVEGRPLAGVHALGDGTFFVGTAAPFGRLSSNQLEQLATFASGDDAELRVTPWRSTVIAPVTRERAQQLLGSLAALDLIIEPDDPRLAVAACPGAPACSSASVNTRDDAALFAPLARDLAAGGTGLHVSGCIKGCAKSDATPVTLVGRDGCYDLVLDGRPVDIAARSGLSVEAAREALRQILADSLAGDALGRKRAGSII